MDSISNSIILYLSLGFIIMNISIDLETKQGLDYTIALYDTAPDGSLIGSEGSIHVEFSDYKSGVRLRVTNGYGKELVTGFDKFEFKQYLKHVLEYMEKVG